MLVVLLDHREHFRIAHHAVHAGATTPAQIQAALQFDMLSDIPEILAAGFAIWMIVKIQQRQAMRLRRLDEEQDTEEEGKEY